MADENKYDYCTCSPDTLFGVYFGCCCKAHDLAYCNEGKITRKEADKNLRDCIYAKFKAHDKKFIGFIISRIYYLAVRIAGRWYWKTWSSAGLEKYK